MPTTYAVIHEENGAFGVSFPDFPGVITGGQTEEEAVRKADEVLTFHVAGMIEDGDTIPQSRSLKELWRDDDFKDAMEDGVLLVARFEVPKRAVRLNISMDEGLVEAVDRAAEAAGQSRSAFLADAARSRLRVG